tara:strand:+ start:13098 stop:14720 length:1623 start_codon:yes stop_codon:yes gene_type:complete
LKNILQGVKQIFPAERLQSNIAIFIAISALAFSVSSSNMPCINADTCAVGSNEVFSGTLSLQNNTQYNTKLTPGSPTGDIVITLPSTTSTLATTSQIPSVPTLPASKIMATDGTGAYSTTDIYPLSIGTTGQVLTVNSGATALEYSSITGVPSLTASKSVATDGTGALVTTDVYPLSLTANKPLVSDGTGALTTASLTADKIMVTDTNGNLDTTNVYPLSFSANKPIVSDVSGNLTDITLTGDTPMKTDANGNLTATDLVPETDLTIGSGTAGQMLAVNSGGTALEFVDAGGGGQWTLKASGQSQLASGGMISGDSNTDQVVLCWGGTNSTDGVDGNYFRMTKGKQYKLVLSTKANLNGYYNSSTQYSNIGTAWIGNGVDCSNGTVPTNSPTAMGYNYMIDNYFLHPSGQGTNYYGTQAYFCNLFAGQTVQSNNMPESWHGEIILNDFQTYFGSVRNGVTAVHDIRFAGNHVSQSPYIGYGGHSTGTCEAYTSTPGGYISDVNDIYGLYFRNIRPSSWNSNAQNSLLYWLYESNDYNNTP